MAKGNKPTVRIEAPMNINPSSKLKLYCSSTLLSSIKSHHLVPATLKLIGHRLDRDINARTAQALANRINIRRGATTKCQQGKNTYFLCHTTHLDDGGAMK
jgi:hypothetical protein